MKRLLCTIVLLFSVGLLFFACSDKSTQPVESSKGTLQNIGNGEGAGITYETKNAYGFIDVDENLILVLVCDDIHALCSNHGGMEWVKFKELLLPTSDPELRRLIMQITACDVNAIVWKADTWPEDFCDFALNNQPFAVGTANFKYTDNDYCAWWQEHPNRKPFGYEASGSVESLTGQKYNFNFFDRIIWDCDGSKFTEDVKINLVPKGF